MVLEAITLVVIGAAYVTGDADRKQKMRKIGSEFVDVAKTMRNCQLLWIEV